MIEPKRRDALLSAIKAGIERARDSNKSGQSMPADDDTAALILEELYRSGLMMGSSAPAVQTGNALPWWRRLDARTVFILSFMISGTISVVLVVYFSLLAYAYMMLIFLGGYACLPKSTNMQKALAGGIFLGGLLCPVGLFLRLS